LGGLYGLAYGGRLYEWAYWGKAVWL